MHECVCGWKCEYRGFHLNIVGCTNPECEYYDPDRSDPDRIMLPSGNWYDLIVPPPTDKDKPEEDFSDLFGDDDDAKTPTAWPPQMHPWLPPQKKD